MRARLLTGAVVVSTLAGWLFGCGGSSSKPSDSGAAGGNSVQTGTGGKADGGTGGAAVTDAGSGTGGRADAGSSGDAAGDASSAAARLGNACNADADCGPGLLCLRATDRVIAGAGGPAHGYCSTRCVQAQVDPCTPIGGVCFEYQIDMAGQSQAYCMKACTFGGTTLNDRVAKCQNRPDVACADFTTVAACLPTCSQDSDCPSPRRCDLQFNVCVDTPATGDRTGVHCNVNPDAGTSNCAGTCLQFGSGTTVTQAMCSSRCVLGELGGCNWVDQTMSLAGGTHGVCAFSSGQNAFAGDLGFCTPECDSTNDCPDTADRAVCDLSIVADVGHGACSFAAPPTPDAGADGGRG